MDAVLISIEVFSQSWLVGPLTVFQPVVQPCNWSDGGGDNLIFLTIAWILNTGQLQSEILKLTSFIALIF